MQALALTLLSIENERIRPYHGQAGIERDGKPTAIESLHWGDGIQAGVTPMFTVPRKDRLLSRSRWQFGDRSEHVWHRSEEK